MRKILKREYRFVTLQSSRRVLVVNFHKKDLKFLASFLCNEVDQFSKYILPDINTVLSGQKERSDFYGNLLGAEYNQETTLIYHQLEDGAAPSYLPTEDFYKLCREFVYVKKILKQSEWGFPFELEDGEWLYD